MYFFFKQVHLRLEHFLKSLLQFYFFAACQACYCMFLMQIGKTSFFCYNKSFCTETIRLVPKHDNNSNTKTQVYSDLQQILTISAPHLLDQSVEPHSWAWYIFWSIWPNPYGVHRSERTGQVYKEILRMLHLKVLGRQSHHYCILTILTQ